MPNVVTFEDGSTVTYLYAADGTKLRTLHNINGTTTQKDYCGSVIYENGTAKLWQTEAGYISMNDSKYHYYLQDHQGNNRMVSTRPEQPRKLTITMPLVDCSHRMKAFSLSNTMARNWIPRKT